MRLVALMVLALVAGAFAQVPTGESKLVSESVARVSDNLEAMIAAGVAENGGDLETQHVHWVFAFSTGHFSGEPLRAQAARETALELLRRFAVPGDTVSAYAFEMDLWSHPGISLNPITLQAGGAAGLDAAARAFPLTAQAGSVGGHDTERSLVSIGNQLSGAHDVVLVVFTNRAASVTTDQVARPLLGENSQPYRAFLAQMWRAPAANRSGASYEAVYDVQRSDGGTVQNTLDVVVAISRQFEGTPLATSRAEAKGEFSVEPAATAPAETATVPEARNTTSTIIWLVLVGGLLLGGYLLFRSGRVSPGMRDPNISVDGTIFSLPIGKDGLVCRVVTKNYRDDSDDAGANRTLYLSSVPVGQAVVGRLVTSKGKLYWHDADFSVASLNGTSVRAPVALGNGGELVVKGEVRDRPGMPPRSMVATIHIERGAKA